MTKKETIKALLEGRYAHRGLHSKPEIPENSMHAFRLAVEEGFGIELDIHLTGDNKLACIHDASLKRTAGVDFLIEEISLAKAQEFYLFVEFFIKADICTVKVTVFKIFLILDLFFY